MTYKEIETHYPDEFRRRQADKLAYRYPRGESYLDMIHRLDLMVHEMAHTRAALPRRASRGDFCVFGASGNEPRYGTAPNRRNGTASPC